MAQDTTSTVERDVENESVFRRVNDEIEAAARSEAQDATFLCECEDPGCHSTIVLSLEEYTWIRRHPTYFVVAAGHEREDTDQGRVVRYYLAYSVVEKLGYAAALAAAAYRGSSQLLPGGADAA
jgi:hypothetical protein